MPPALQLTCRNEVREVCVCVCVAGGGGGGGGTDKAPAI